MEVDAPLSSREVLIDGFTSKITPHSPAMDYQYLGNHGTVQETTCIEITYLSHGFKQAMSG